MKRNEIGSDFWSIPVTDKTNALFWSKAVWFNSGRAALGRIIQTVQATHRVTSVMMPSWCCDSMIIPFVKAGMRVQFYPVFVQNGVLHQEIGEIAPGTVLFLMDYFGYTAAPIQYHGHPVIIRDITHSVFTTAHNDADYYFGSLRKWCGFKTGGFAMGISEESLPPDEKYIRLRKSAINAKAEYILGKSDSKAFLDVFAEAEAYLEHCPVAGACPEDIELATRLDIATIKARRRENAAVLMDALQEFCLFPRMEQNDCPLFVPILVPNRQRDVLKRHLIQQLIYCPAHWPISKYHHLNEKTRYLYENELSLVCDQRYTPVNMERITEAVWTFIKR